MYFVTTNCSGGQSNMGMSRWCLSGPTKSAECGTINLTIPIVFFHQIFNSHVSFCFSGLRDEVDGNQHVQGNDRV